MAEIAVAVLEIEELEPEPGRQSRGRHEIVRQPVELVVGQHANAVGESRVEQRVRVRDERVGRVVEPMAREPARVGELQADEERVRRRATETFRMRVPERRQQAPDARRVRRRQQQLLRVGAAVLPHGDGFAAPDERGAALTESLPTAPRQV